MNCLHCHKPIQGKRNTKKYCSNTCKQYAYLNRSFASSSNLNSVSLINVNHNETQIGQQNQENNTAVSNNGNNEFYKTNEDNNTINKENNLLIKTSKHHDNNKQVIEEREYIDIQPDILEKIQRSYILSNVSRRYFTDNSSKGGRITEHNISAFAYMLPRIRCIIENLFQLSYKRKLYYKTAITICKAVEEMLLSEHIKMLPADFPFFEDLLKLHEQLSPIAKSMEDDNEGIKFTLNKTAIVRYITILNLIRDYTKKLPFQKLFPELYKMKAA